MKIAGKQSVLRVAITAVMALVLWPLLSSFSAAVATEVPCQRAASMESHQGLAHSTMSKELDGDASDMDCCGDDESAMPASAPMSECTFDCKASCPHAVTAVLTSANGVPSPPAFQPFTESPPDRLTPHAVGFTTPPPRI